MIRGPTMKLWDKVLTCCFLLGHVMSSPLLRGSPQSPSPARLLRHESRGSTETTFPASGSGRNSHPRSTPQTSPLRSKDGMATPVDLAVGMATPQRAAEILELVRRAISRLRRSSELTNQDSARERRSSELTNQDSARERRSRRKSKARSGPGGGLKAAAAGAGEGEGSGRRRGRGRQGQGQGHHGCRLRQIQLSVSDLGLGYQTREEMIFRYCSGPCANSETNYDKILNNLTQNRKLKLLRDSPPHACCRPIAFDDDLSFLDDNLIYHTMKKHSARKCGCV